MKKTAFAALLFLAACQSPEDKQTTKSLPEDSMTAITSSPVDSLQPPSGDNTAPAAKVYSNEAFKDVRVRLQHDTVVVTGKARVFEAVFSWVLEGDLGELKKGHEITNAGAPEFGTFQFQFTLPRGSREMKLILFEASAKDGSPQHQLAIPL